MLGVVIYTLIVESHMVHLITTIEEITTLQEQIKQEVQLFG